MARETPAFTLTDRDFSEKVRYCAEWLGTAPNLDQFLSLKMRFFGALQAERAEYFDAPDYRLLDLARVSPRLSILERVNRFHRPPEDPDIFRGGDFFEGDGPHDMDTSVAEVSLSTKDRFLLVRHESGPEIILLLGAIAGSVALLKEVVALIGNLAAIHNDKWKRRFAGLQEEYDRLRLPAPKVKELEAAYEAERLMSVERRQYEAGRLRQEVLIRIPVTEAQQRGPEILSALQDIVSPADESSSAASKNEKTKELPNE